jgi:hypothetical protein
MRSLSVPQLLRLKLPGELDAWKRAGFARNSDGEDIALGIGGVDIGVYSHRGHRGTHGDPASWGWADGPLTRDMEDMPRPAAWEDLHENGWTEVDIDGISTSIDDLSRGAYDELLRERAYFAEEHPNCATSIYSVAVTTPDIHRTIAAFVSAGLELRKLADPSPFSATLSMAFFKFGAPKNDVLLELVAPREPGAPVNLPGLPAIRGGRDAPAEIAGLVVTVPCLDAVRRALGAEHLGRARPAVQGKGRMIAPLCHERVDLPLPLAFITPPREA